MDACAYLEEPIVMTFGEFRFGVNKEGSYRLEVPISSEFSAVDSNFSSSDEEFSSTYFVDNKASGKLAKIFSNTSFESSADSFISSDSDSVDTSTSSTKWMELQNTGPPDLSRTWTMNFDGSKRLEGAGAGVILVSPEGDKLKYVLRMTFPNASNNEAEYEALIHMKMAKACGATRLKIFGDSQLVAQQVMNQCDAVNESMIAYKEVYNELEKLFDGCEVNHISRMSNDEADVLANIGSQCLAIPPGVFWEEISERSTKPAKTKKEKKEKTSTVTKDTAEEEEEEQELVMMVQVPWMQAYISYILRKVIPDDPKQGE
ncbi:hypothetical protein QYE76_048143 [Lolium multiflorum]|uniref:RNase H type-1 domain-containing protein n=1 Tax=Lolium multiflorum TaxID=4521 RepID=A0AAD8USZ1_LOLMU|nr:hypothetical protein QYE76_048143 [Lolium multiflorum]